MSDDDKIVDEVYRAWQSAQRKKRISRLKSAVLSSDNIRDVTEGPIVGQLVQVFDELREKNIGGRGK